MPPSRPGDFIDADFRPLEFVTQFRQWSRHQPLMDFNDIKERAIGIGMLKVIDDFSDRRLRAAEVETGLCVQCVRPWWREKCHDPVLWGKAVLAEQSSVVAMHQPDRCGDRRKVVRAHFKDRLLGFEARPFGSRKVAEYRVQRIARTCEWIDHTEG